MKRGTPDHFKTRRLQKLLRLPKYAAVGILECLFHVAQAHARRGDIGRLTDAEISHGLGWGGSPDRLIGALVEVGWLDRCSCHRLKVHDWPQHADQTVHKGLKKVGLSFLHCYTSSGTVPEPVGNGSDPSVAVASDQPKPKPEPLPDRPARETWLTRYGVSWKARWGDESEPPFGEMASAFRDPEKRHGPEDLDARWRRFLMACDRSQFARPRRFIEGLGEWAERGGSVALAPARASPPTPKEQKRRDVLAASIVGGMKGDGTLGGKGGS